MSIAASVSSMAKKRINRVNCTLVNFTELRIVPIAVELKSAKLKFLKSNVNNLTV